MYILVDHQNEYHRFRDAESAPDPNSLHGFVSFSRFLASNGRGGRVPSRRCSRLAVAMRSARSRSGWLRVRRESQEDRPFGLRIERTFRIAGRPTDASAILRVLAYIHIQYVRTYEYVRAYFCGSTYAACRVARSSLVESRDRSNRRRAVYYRAAAFFRQLDVRRPSSSLLPVLLFRRRFFTKTDGRTGLDQSRQT